MPDIAVVGPWAKEKLEALERYLDFYTKVLKNQRWRTIYVDAFAGGGRALVRADSAQVDESIPLFEPEPASDVDRTELIDAEEQGKRIDGAVRQLWRTVLEDRKQKLPPAEFVERERSLHNAKPQGLYVPVA